MSVTRPILIPSPADPPPPVVAAVVSGAVVAPPDVSSSPPPQAPSSEQEHEQRQQPGEPHADSSTGRGGIETPPLPWNRVAPSPW